MNRQVILVAAAGAVALSCAASPLHAQTKRRVIRSTVGQTEDNFIRNATTNATTQEGEAGADVTTAPSTGPTTSVASTGPASKPSRVDAFLKAKFSRTTQSTLAALTAKPDEKADDAAKFAADVTAGRWDAVEEAIATFDGKDAKKVYKHLITELVSGGGGGGGGAQSMPPNVPPEMQARMAAQMQQQGGGGGGGAGGAYLLPQDVIAIMRAAPADIDDELIEPLAQLLSRAVQRTNVVEPVVAALDKGILGVGGATDEKSRLRAANLLMSASRPIEAGKFLPPLKDKLHDNDVKLLDLHARHLIAQANEQKKPGPRERAWTITQSIITHAKAEQKDRDAAIARALELWPLISKSSESAWFKESFGGDAQANGLAIIATAGTAASQNFTNRDLSKRQQGLDQQKKLVDALLDRAGEGKDAARRWSPVLNVLATVWIQEADYTKPRQTQKQMMANQSRRYSPYYYEEQSQRQMMMNQNEPPPLEAEQLLETAPSEAWLAALDDSLRVRVLAGIAEMHFKNDEPARAMPIVERIARNNPTVARPLADDLLRNLARVWDPSSSQRSSSYYYGPYGYMQQSTGGIPLTRSAQTRNLAELAIALRKLESLPLGEPASEALSEDAIASAFANAHSPAEVFRIEDITTVLGRPESVPADVLVEVLQTMRQRLATSWRSPQVQQQQKTKRTDKELEAEATRGYQLLTTLVEKRLESKPDWKLQTLLASAIFDWAEFDYGRQVELATYTQRRDKCFELFHQAAAQYVVALPELKESEQTSLVYQQWFNAALGASDLAALTRQAAPSQSEIERIRLALQSIPGDEAVEKHVESFGKWLSGGSQSLKPELKHRFLKAGLEVVKEHPSAEEARKLVRYYADLLNEIELHAQLDGDPAIGHGKPFGLHLSIRHTQAVGRESGGFNKYLTNQQSGRSSYYYMSGPNGPVNYRDDFEKKVRAALVDRFDIKSITWFDEKVESRPFGRSAWRETPLAYVMLQPKDASVDKVPPVQMDLDFSDKNGTVILPVSSQVILVDARSDNPPPRPLRDVEVTQILDQRDAKNGKLSLDIKATGKGLLGHLDTLLDVNVTGFTIDKIDDQGLAVNAMDAEGEQVVPASERSWLVTLSAAQAGGSKATPASFKFPQPKSKDIKVAYKQYADADVTDVDPQVAVTGLPLGTSRRATWLIVLALVAAIAGGAWYVLRRRRGRKIEAPLETYRVPEHVSPFTVIDLLKRIEHDRGLGLAASQREQLTREILQLQERYFAPHSNGDAASAVSLTTIASQWVRQVQR